MQRSVLSLILVFSVAAAAAEPVGPIIAVFQIKDSTGKLVAADVQQLTRYLATKLAEEGHFQVVPESDMRRALQSKAAESLQECYDDTCQIQVGRELAAQKSLLTEIVKLGDSCAVTATLYDLGKAASEKAASERGGCTMNDLVPLVERVVAKLQGIAVADLSAPAGKPAPPPRPPPRPGVKLSPAVLRFVTNESKLDFHVEVIGSDGYAHQCGAPLRAGVPCIIDNVAQGEAQLFVRSPPLVPRSTDLDMEEDPETTVVTVRTMANLWSWATWFYGGIFAAGGIAMIAVGLGVDSNGLIYGGIPLSLVGGGMVYLGFTFDDQIVTLEDTLDAG